MKLKKKKVKMMNKGQRDYLTGRVGQEINNLRLKLQKEYTEENPQAEHPGHGEHVTLRTVVDWIKSVQKGEKPENSLEFHENHEQYLNGNHITNVFKHITHDGHTSKLEAYNEWRAGYDAFNLKLNESLALKQQSVMDQIMLGDSAEAIAMLEKLASWKPEL
jgi:hypothetical protein